MLLFALVLGLLMRGASNRVDRSFGAVVLVNDARDDAVEDEGFGIGETVQEGIPEGLERGRKSEDDEGGELPILVGEPVEGDTRAVGGESGELGLHGVGAVVVESEAVEVAPVDDGRDAILLLVPRSEEFPEFVCSELSLGGWSCEYINPLVVEEDLDILGTCSGDEASGLFVGGLPFLNGGKLLGSGRSCGGLG